MANLFTGKKGDVWVSAILYMGLGIVVISLILGAGLPLIEKVRDRNTIIQTKNLFFTIDLNVDEILKSGPGARRALEPFEIKQGEFIVDESQEILLWRMKTKSQIIDVGYVGREGNVEMLLEETSIKDEYIINLRLNYTSDADIILDSPYGNPFAGSYRLFVEHTGQYGPDSRPKLKISII